MARTNTIKIDANVKSFSEARAFVEETLDKHHVSTSIAFETMLLFEALFNEVISQIDDEDTKIEISNVNGLGRTEIKMIYAGKRFSLPEGDVSTDPAAKIIEVFSDKLSSSTVWQLIR